MNLRSQTVTLTSIDDAIVAAGDRPWKAMARGQLVSTARVEAAIVLLRGHRVMLDSDLAALYGVGTKALNQAVSRKDDFVFRLTREEALTCPHSADQQKLQTCLSRC